MEPSNQTSSAVADFSSVYQCWEMWLVSSDRLCGKICAIPDSTDSHWDPASAILRVVSLEDPWEFDVAWKAY